MIPVYDVVFERIGDAAEDIAFGEGLADCSAGQVISSLGEACALKVGIAFGYFATSNAAGVGIFVVEVNKEAVLFGGIDGNSDHIEEGVGEIGLLESLTGMNEESANALVGHFGNLPADFVFGEAVVPEPEGVKAWGVVHEESFSVRDEECLLRQILLNPPLKKGEAVQWTERKSRCLL